MRVFLSGISFYSSKVGNWSELAKVFRGEVSMPADPVEEGRYQPKLLPRNERRRATNLARLCFRVLDQLVEHTGVDASSLRSVFASSGGDYDVIHKICTALAFENQLISPTDFHNSVHNGAAGYWNIANGCQATSTSISAGLNTVVMGLLEAALICRAEQEATTLVAYDIPTAMPIAALHPILAPLGVGLLLATTSSNDDICSLELTHTPGLTGDTVRFQRLQESIAPGNPIGQLLPLLEAIAVRTPAVELPNLSICIDYAQ